MDAISTLPIDKIHTDVHNILADEYGLTCADITLYVYGSLPNERGTADSDIDIIASVEVEQWTGSPIDFISETSQYKYNNRKLDLNIKQENEAIKYLRGACNRKYYTKIYNLCEDTFIGHSQL
jgi:predicted nucleotidyltransferase